MRRAGHQASSSTADSPKQDALARPKAEYGSRGLAEACAPALSELDLVSLWQGQRLPAGALVTRDGTPLAILSPGRRVGGGGPDFREAVIATPAGMLTGDVELHVRASDFARHGHGQDPAYNGVVLHVVFWDDQGRDTLLAGGLTATVAALEPWLERRRQEIQEWSTRPPAGQEPCADVLSRKGSGPIAAILDERGDRRLQQKTDQVRRALRGATADDALWAGLLEALGLGGNRGAFRELASSLPWGRLTSAIHPLPRRERPAAAFSLLASAWSGGRSSCRPANSPARRLEGAGHLASRFCGQSPASALVGALEKPDSQATLLRMLTVSQDSRGLIGRGKALEMIINAVLPFALAWNRRPSPTPMALALFSVLPRPGAYGCLRRLHSLFQGSLRLNARRQQGMLSLYKERCSRSACSGCPLS